MRLPKLPTFLLPARWYWGGLCARMKPAGKGDKSKSCRAGSPRYECFPGRPMIWRVTGCPMLPAHRVKLHRLNAKPMARADGASPDRAFVGHGNVFPRAARRPFNRVGNAPRVE